VAWGDLLRGGLQLGHLASLAPSWRRFVRAAQDPAGAQARRLDLILRAGEASAYGRQHGFARLSGPRAYQDRVPEIDYDALEPWVERIANGEQAVLSAAPVRMLERSGGASGHTKLIPYTDGLLAEFAAATGPWLWNLHRSQPRLLGGSSYWSVSPVAQERQFSPGGLPIGFEDDTEYFGPVVRWALRRSLAAPPDLARIRDTAAWRQVTLRCLLQARSLGLISVWSPTFLTLLMDGLQDRFAELADTLPQRERAALWARVERAGGVTGAAIWPRLALISCWADGPSAGFLPALRRHFPGTPVQPKGLLATEGVVTFPLWGQPGAVAALAGHFLEFRELDAAPGRRPSLAHELRAGARYQPLLTTSGGLYRYALGDCLRCVGHFLRAPLLQFEGRIDRVSDQVGEKISAAQVQAGLAGLGPTLPFEFALVAPCAGPPLRYRAYVETAAPLAALQAARRSLEASLAAGHHYAYARQLGQLAGLEVVRVRRGWEGYQARMEALGLRAGDLKPCPLETRGGWDEVWPSVPSGAEGVFEAG